MMRRLIRSQLDRYFHPFARKCDLDNLYAQLSALLEIRDMAGPNISLGLLRGFALSPDALMVMLRDISTRNAPRVIEFGAGESTIAIAAVLKNMGSGSLVTIEHDPEFQQKIARRLGQSQLASIVDMRLAQIRNYPPRKGFAAFSSYDLDGIDFEFDVAIVDGPIVAAFGSATRLVPLEWCASRLAGCGVVYLDDAARPDEKKVVNSLRATIPCIDAEMIETEKGLVRLFRSPRGGVPE